jgi:hypothetical protein
MTPKNRQLRGRFTGGQQDVEAFRALLLKSVDPDEWDLTWDEVGSFGNVGPLRKWTFGFTSRS